MSLEMEKKKDPKWKTWKRAN